MQHIYFSISLYNLPWGDGGIFSSVTPHILSYLHVRPPALLLLVIAYDSWDSLLLLTVYKIVLQDTSAATKHSLARLLLFKKAELS